MIRGPQATGAPTCVITDQLTGFSYLNRDPGGVSFQGPLRTGYASRCILYWLRFKVLKIVWKFGVQLSSSAFDRASDFRGLTPITLTTCGPSGPAEGARSFSTSPYARRGYLRTGPGKFPC
ncbi:hypothetical protein TNCV_1425151 [Trichonephila clavipes]|nr:hypothetical protein TNCV_1425151 [Trichonephila clavipes]